MANSPEEYIEQSRQESYSKVPYIKVRAALDQIAEHFEDDVSKLDEIQITFEYLIGSFFPNIIQNIHDEANKQHTLGYMEGYQQCLNDHKILENKQ